MTEVFVASTNRKLQDAEDALHYCLHECPNQKFGCAKDCSIRKRFKIPPHGSKYPKVKEN